MLKGRRVAPTSPHPHQSTKVSPLHQNTGNEGKERMRTFSARLAVRHMTRSHPIGQNSVSWPHLTGREPESFNIGVCPEVERGFWGLLIQSSTSFLRIITKIPLFVHTRSLGCLYAILLLRESLTFFFLLLLPIFSKELEDSKR